MPGDSEEPNIAQALGFLRRRGIWIVLCFLLAVAAAFGYSKRQTKEYTATASIVFNNDQLNQVIAGLTTSSSSSALQQQSSNLELLDLGDMAEKTAAILGHGLTAQAVSESVSIVGQPESSVAGVSATTISPKLSAEIANIYARHFVRVQGSANRRYYRSALAVVNKQLGALSPSQRVGTDGLNLQYRAQSLEFLAELQPNTVEVAQEASVPTEPSSPKTSRNTLIGGVLGLFLGIGLALLLERLDPRIRDTNELEAIYRLTLLGVVPQSAALSRFVRDGKDRSPLALPLAETEVFHMIRARLRSFNADRDVRMVLVSSAAPGEGKTTVASHLAGAAARMGSRVLLLEANLRRLSVAQHLDIQSGPGLSDVLMGAVSLSEATQVIDLDFPPVDGSKGRRLDVLVAGAALPPSPVELIESQAMDVLLTQAKSSYDLVVIDTPELTAVSDAFLLLPKVDGVVIVGRIGRSRRDVAERLRHLLETSGAPLVGVVANGVKSGGHYLGVSAYNSNVGKLASTDAPVSGELAGDEVISNAKG